MRLSAVLWDHKSAISLNSKGAAPLEIYSCGDIFIVLSVDTCTAVLFVIPLCGQGVGEVSSWGAPYHQLIEVLTVLRGAR